MDETNYTESSDEVLQDLFVDLVEWCHLHPDDKDGKARLKAVKEELIKRGILE